MPLTIADMMQMEPFANFKLIAGANGIGRTLETVNILDYEYTSEYNPAELPDSFKKNALVLSSLLFAKYQPEQLINVVKKLVDYRTSALAVKSIILKDLPEDVIDYCNRHSFPVFLFSENEGYFENIITFITDEIRQSTDYAHFEEKLSLLSQDNLSGLEVQRIAMELFPELELPYRLTAINPQLTETAFYKKLRHSHKLPKVPVYSFCKTYVTALPAGNPKTYYNEFQAVIDSLYLNEKLCYTGFSNLHDKMDEFHYAFNECFYSCTYAQKQKLPKRFSLHKCILSLNNNCKIILGGITMSKNDDLAILNNIYQNCKMASECIDGITEKCSDENLKDYIQKQRMHYDNSIDKVSRRIRELGGEPEEPPKKSAKKKLSDLKPLEGDDLPF